MPQLAKAWRGTWVSSQRLRLGCGGESPRFLATRQWLVTRALALQLRRKGFLQRQQVVKQIKYLLRGGKKYSHVDRHTDRLRGRTPELHPCCSLNYFYGAFLPFFPLASFTCFTVHIWHISGSSHVCTYVLAKIDFTEKVSG